MGKSRSFSIYLLKQGMGATNSLKKDHGLKDDITATDLPENSTIFILDNEPHAPWWKDYFGVNNAITQVTKGALIFIPVKNRCFALSFGHVYHNLEDSSYEYDFGLRVTLNSVDSNELKSTDSLEPGAGRRQRTQVPIYSDLTFFDFDSDSEILKRLTGKVKSDHKELFKHATGSNSLRISSSIQPSDLAKLCEKLLDLYASDDYKTTFPNIQNIAPVRDPTLIDTLNEILLTAFRDKDDTLNLTVPDIINHSDNVFSTFSGCGPGDLYEDVFMGRYYSYLETNGKNTSNITLNDLKRHQLKLVNENNEDRENYSILKCFLFDTNLPSGAGTYHLTDGNWYKVESDYVTKLRTFLDQRCVETTLPGYTHKTEGEYNRFVAENHAEYLCLDGMNISPNGKTQIEPCDLYSVQGESVALYHIKVSTFSAKLSHLFSQGKNSIELLKMNQESREKLDKLIDSFDISNEKKDAFKMNHTNRRYSVHFGIVTHKCSENKSLNLPLFSQISLMRTIKSLQMMDVPATYGFIMDNSQKTAGKKRKRKPREKKA